MENKTYESEHLRPMMDEEKEEATKIAGHLATHYLNAVWDMSSGRGFPSEDVTNIQEKYKQVEQQVVKEYEKSLNEKVLKFFMLKRKKKNEKISIDDVVSIIKYKLVSKPKRKLACFMWDKEYNIYPLVRR
jgi:hypothetical protein